MALTPIAIIALVTSIIVLLKIVTLTVNKKIWINNVSKPIYGNANISTLVLAILAVIVLYYLLLELTIVQVFAVIAFTSLLIAIGFLQYPKEVAAMGKSVIKKGFSWIEWILVLVWVFLAAWAVVESLGLV